MAKLNLIETGIYNVPEAAKLVGATERKVRGWVLGYGKGEGPLIDNELGYVDGRLAFSFVNLMEIRFIDFFEKAGMKLRDIRAILSEAKDLLNHAHPFATSTVYMTDGKKILAKIAKRNGIEDLYDLKSRNYEMKPVVLASLKKDVEFNPVGEVRSWRPRPQTAPHVIVHPKIAFGQPVLRESRIPTRTLRDAVVAESSSETVAEQFDVPLKQVREAVNFERELKMAA
jgi:uncharacterized protein (DUF433 family)/DNA-binding transcriptional MerR regulator